MKDSYLDMTPLYSTGAKDPENVTFFMFQTKCKSLFVKNFTTRTLIDLKRDYGVVFK